MSQKSGIVAFAWGTNPSGKNRRIAEYAVRMAQRNNMPIFTQRAYVTIPDTEALGGVRENPSRPAPTDEIARQALLWASENSFQRLYVVAATPHLRRCGREIRRAIEVAGLSIDIITCRIPGTYGGWFVPENGQPHTQHRLVWHLREALIFLMPRWLYRWLAS